MSRRAPTQFPFGHLTDDADRNRPFTIGFVGTMKAWHGLEVLIDAFSLFHAELPESRLILVGDGPETPALQRQLAGHGSDVYDAGAVNIFRATSTGLTARKS